MKVILQIGPSQNLNMAPVVKSNHFGLMDALQPACIVYTHMASAGLPALFLSEHRPPDYCVFAQRDKAYLLEGKAERGNLHVARTIGTYFSWSGNLLAG